jgi:hypothetical protein
MSNTTAMLSRLYLNPVYTNSTKLETNCSDSALFCDSTLKIVEAYERERPGILHRCNQKISRREFACRIMGNNRFERAQAPMRKLIAWYEQKNPREPLLSNTFRYGSTWLERFDNETEEFDEREIPFWEEQAVLWRQEIAEQKTKVVKARQTVRNSQKKRRSKKKSKKGFGVTKQQKIELSK